jgi:hypothetical protein
MAADWVRLFAMACNLIDQVNAEFPVIDEWTMGGGTALMLRIGHRQSHDIDIFVDDSQILGYLDPDKAGFPLIGVPARYGGDGSTFRKFIFPGFGEIDFIVSQHLTDQPFTKTMVEGRLALLETVGEIIAKKIFHRGASITPRDVFDIAAAAGRYRSDIETALAPYPDRVNPALKAIQRQNRAYFDAVIDDLQITGE